MGQKWRLLQNAEAQKFPDLLSVLARVKKTNIFLVSSYWKLGFFVFLLECLGETESTCLD